VYRQRIPLSLWPLLTLLAAALALRGTWWFGLAYAPLLAYATCYIALIPKLPAIAKTDLSYGLYLYGWPMQQLALIAGATTVLGNIAAATALALVCATLSWFLIEQPALRWKRRLIARVSVPADANR
jgi:peptidoglycan/LPS O-acetylase OafA/YrhL